MTTKLARRPSTLPYIFAILRNTTQKDEAKEIYQLKQVLATRREREKGPKSNSDGKGFLLCSSPSFSFLLATLPDPVT